MSGCYSTIFGVILKELVNFQQGNRIKTQLPSKCTNPCRDGRPRPSENSQIFCIADDRGRSSLRMPPKFLCIILSCDCPVTRKGCFDIEETSQMGLRPGACCFHCLFDYGSDWVLFCRKHIAKNLIFCCYDRAGRDREDRTRLYERA